MRDYLYLSGPMTGIKDFNRPLFNEAADHLRNHQKLTVWNPAETDGPEVDAYRERRKVPDHLYNRLLEKDLWVIEHECWGIVMLPGWQESPGCRAELNKAMEIGLKCMHIKNLGFPVSLIDKSMSP